MGVPPKEFYCFYQTPLGLIRICETGGFLTRVNFVEQTLVSKKNQSESIPLGSLLKDACRQLDEYFEGKRKKFE